MADESPAKNPESPGTGSVGRTPTVFVTDPAAESARIADMLRMVGYAVVDVPLSMLVSRAQAQRPNVVLVDIDAPSALVEVGRLRRLPGGGAIDFVYFGSGQGDIRTADDALANDGSAFFGRPIDIGSLIRRVEALTGGPILRPDARPSTPPPSLPQKLPKDSTKSVPPERTSSASLPALGARDVGPPLPMSSPSLADLVDQPRSLASFGTVSNELQQLLAEAELRVDVTAHAEAPLPSPEEEIENVLPADVLASLDEPIEADEDEEHEVRVSSGPGAEGTGTHGTGAHGRHTTASGGLRYTTASGTARTPHTHERRVGSESPPRELTPSRRTSEPPALPSSGKRGTDAGSRPPASPASPASPAAAPRSTTSSAPEGIPIRSAPIPVVPVSAAVPVVSPAPGPSANPTRIERPTMSSAQAPVSIPLPPPPQVITTGGPPSAGPSSIGEPPRSEAPRTELPRPDSVTIATRDLVGALPSQKPSPAAVSVAASRVPAGPSPQASTGTILLRASDARRFLGQAITRRLSGTLCFDHDRVLRRLVIREGDVVTAASTADAESLVHFLGARGELPKGEVDRLAAKIPPQGRHAGAALVAHGFLRQDQLWPVLRAHAEWIATTILRLGNGVAQIEPEAPGRLRAEPSVFGAATGAELFVELVRRAVSPDEAVLELGGEESRIGDGPSGALLSECALSPPELELVSRARGLTVGELLSRSSDAEIASVVHALSLLGVLDVVPAAVGSRGSAVPSNVDLEAAALDDEAIRARVRARLELVDEGDYFSILGVSRDATSYEVRRAFIELRRTFEPTRLLTPALADLADDVRKIVVVLEEAYEILRDVARRERYRRAIDARP